jgi:hypothetical protein
MTYDGQQCENTLWVENTEAWDGAGLNELASEVFDWWVSSYATIVSDQVTLSEVVCTDMSSDSGPVGSVSGVGSTGEQLGGGLPGNCSVAVSFRSTTRGRSARGRNYVVGIPIEQMVTMSEVESAYATQVVTAYVDFKTAITAADWTWVIASRFSGVDPDTGNPIPREEGVTFPVATILLVDRTIDSQRRRLPGRGT